MTPTNRILCLACTVFLLTLPRIGTAQSVWLEATEDTELRIEYQHPARSDAGYSTFSGIWTMSVSHHVGQGKELYVEVPHARVTINRLHIYPFSSSYSSDSYSAFGNLYVGMVLRKPGSNYRTLFGGRLPTASDSNAATWEAARTDVVDRAEAFLPNIASVSASFEYRQEELQGVGLRTRLSPVVWIDTEDELDDSFEVWALYNIQIVQAARGFTVGVGVSGRCLVSESELELSERTVHDASVFVNWNLGRWRPCVRLQVPVDEELRNRMNPSLVLGVGLSTQ